ncbi:MAG: hypothetical protein LAT78_10240 [Roseinatronobacter sp.]|nr:hypothetical protein [Roseinatronobacter sp.]
MMKTHVLKVAALGLALLAAPAVNASPSEQPITESRKSSPTVGIGLSFAFGSGRIEPGVGIRVFSDNRRSRPAASVGVDYMFMSQSIRGTVGVAYMGRNVFGGLDLGYNFTNGGIDFGLSAGGAATKSRFRTIQVPQMTQ